MFGCYHAFEPNLLKSLFPLSTPVCPSDVHENRGRGSGDEDFNAKGVKAQRNFIVSRHEFVDSQIVCLMLFCSIVLRL